MSGRDTCRPVAVWQDPDRQSLGATCNGLQTCRRVVSYMGPSSSMHSAGSTQSVRFSMNIVLKQQMVVPGQSSPSSQRRRTLTGVYGDEVGVLHWLAATSQLPMTSVVL